jgi:hypothetical protein
MSNRTLTSQMLFDVVAEHLLAQGKKSTLGIYNNCAYRGQRGLRCAVGVVILDDEYTDKMEASTVRDLVARGLLPTRLVPHESLLVALQDVHDATEPEGWRSALWLVAYRYGLSAAALVPT